MNLLSVNGVPDGSKDDNKLSRDTRAVISDARETLAEARDDPGGLRCLREQMCHPLATVVPYPQWPCGRQRGSYGLKMIPLLTSSRVGCREAASLREEGAAEEERSREVTFPPFRQTKEKHHFSCTITSEFPGVATESWRFGT
ncbi:hypothetical protein Q8A73_007538 [Channa argus]|nr:hypothetical protein Q8A73_007538 [Channa argus]